MHTIDEVQLFIACYIIKRNAFSLTHIIVLTNFLVSNDHNLDLWAYLSHNYEFIEQGTCSQGLKYSWGTGRATGQTFAYNNACGDEVHQYQTWAGGNGNIGSAPSNEGQL